MSNKRMWQILPGQGFSMSLEQERAFVLELKERSIDSKKKGRYNRDDLIIVLTALRCGTSVDSLLKMAEGCDVENLYISYLKLEEKRFKSVEAWNDLILYPDYAHVLKNKNNIKKIMPFIGSKLEDIILEVKSESIKKEQMLDKIMDIASNVTKVSMLASSKENELSDFINKRSKISEKKAVEIGVELYDPIRPGIYGNNFYLPNRVASLTPIRVRDLLNEKKVF
jgi:hypothetical protein